MPNHHQRACTAWDTLSAAAESRDTYTYKGLGGLIGVHPRAMRFVLEPIQHYCLDENLPPLTVLVHNAETGSPGTGFIGAPRAAIDRARESVYLYQWASINNPFEYARGGIDPDQLIRKCLDNPAASSEVFARVRVRGVAQQLFRRIVMEAYGGRCAICEANHPAVLEAAHIVPWSACSDQQRLDVRNGILLCANHHRLLDAEVISVSDDYRIRLAESHNSRHGLVDSTLVGLQGKTLRLPSHSAHYPVIR